MKKISHSEITTYLDCQRKWDLIYNKGLKIDNIHFQFGSMAHKVMETNEIPDENLYPELKEAFGISSWSNYFGEIFKELSKRMSDYTLTYREFKIETDGLVGVIDAVWTNKFNNKILITDYKFSSGSKGVVDISIDEQMYIYAFGYAKTQGVPLENIQIGYINIPKKELDKPRVLKNGSLSKDKSQCVSYETYLQAIHDNNLNEEDYQDILTELKDKNFIEITISSINYDRMCAIMSNIDNIIKDMQKGYILEKHSYMCKNCEFLEKCKFNPNF